MKLNSISVLSGSFHVFHNILLSYRLTNQSFLSVKSYYFTAWCGLVFQSPTASHISQSNVERNFPLKLLLKVTLIATVFTTLNITSYGQGISDKEKNEVVAKVKGLLIEHFISTDKTKIIIDSLHAASFSGVNSKEEFVKRLNKELFHYSSDKHLSIEYNPNYAKELESNNDDKVEQAKRELRENYGFDQTNILSGNLGYIKLRYFSDTSNSKSAALSALKAIKNTKSLILDLRGNSGGSASMVQLLSSSFLSSIEEPLLQITYKRGDTVTLKTYADANRLIYTNPVIIFCDKQTFSAAEAFTLIMKNRNRAIAIGDTTAGAGNIAGPHVLSRDFIITIPVGKIVDPLTNTGWEGTGVIPDISIISHQKY